MALNLHRKDMSISDQIKNISEEVQDLFTLVNFVIICIIISLFGIVTNVMNVIVFYKQGFSNTMNISFFGLAISDMLALVGIIWNGICAAPVVVNFASSLAMYEIRYLTGGIPHAMFSRVTGWITVFITAERCLCITMPLKVKQIITPSRTIMIICGIYMTVVASFLPLYASSYFDWRFYPNKNKTLIGVFTITSMQIVIYIIYSFLGMLLFILVIVFTIVLVMQLKSKSKWRRKTNMDQTRSEAISTRERKTMNMVAMIATVLIVCYTPGVVVSTVSFFEPEIHLSGKYIHLFHVLWSSVFIFQAINSSVNIFLYYKMSTKFRDTFNELFITWKTVTPDAG